MLQFNIKMLQKLKDGASMIKAKLGGDKLDGILIEVVSEQNWQASTHQLHEIANSAYNYEKWQIINQFIWQRLKNTKSWKKILKTLNLVDFLIRNGPPSIISNFKYDIYQLQIFESYNICVDGIDKGQPIREKAKGIIELLRNEQLLESERAKAKNIREKMSYVLGGSVNSDSCGGSNEVGYNKHNGSYDNNQPKDKPNTYNYGNSLGEYGDYTYQKSTIDKYKNANYDKSVAETKKQEKKPDIYVETRKPFEKLANKLCKPGDKKEHAMKQTNTSQSINIKSPLSSKSGDDIIYLFDAAVVPQVSIQKKQNEQVQKSVVQNNQQIQQNQVLQPKYNTTLQSCQNQQPQKQPNQQSYQPNAGYIQVYNLNQIYQPNQFPQLSMQFNQHQHQTQHFYGFPQYSQGMQPTYNVLQSNYSPYINPMYPTTAPMTANSINQGHINTGITLDSNPTPAQQKQSEKKQSTNPATAQDINWLYSVEKGLIDFSDFSSQLKKESKKTPKQNIENSMQTGNWN